MSIIQSTIQAISVGEGGAYKNLTIFPLLVEKPKPANYHTLDEAMAAGTVRVREVSESGSVPELSFYNDGDLAVLLLDGEEVVGAKQNRVLNLSILAPANRGITIPVSCVEQGRWSDGSKGFSHSDHVMFSRGRSSKAASVSRSMKETGSRRSDQSEVWGEISEKSERIGVHSPTESMSDIYDSRKNSVDEFVANFSITESQVGAVFCIDGAVAGVDLFDAPETLEKLLPKLVRSYALDAVEKTEQFINETPKNEAIRFTEMLSTTQVEEFPSVGLGNDLRLHSAMISGGALVDEGRIVHLGAFPLMKESPNEGAPRGTRMMRSSRRRRTH
jgi:hypothetical protein